MSSGCDKTGRLFLSWGGGEGEGGKVEDACQKIWIQPLKETNLGVAWALFDS